MGLTTSEALAPVPNHAGFLERQKSHSRNNIRKFVKACAKKYNLKPPFADVACGYRTNQPEATLTHTNPPLYIAFDQTRSFDKPIQQDASPNLQANAQRIPLPNDSIPTILCTEALEHIDNDAQALSEMRRVLEPGGFLLITLPGIGVPLHEKDYQKDHRRYSLQSAVSILEGLGFEVMESKSCQFENKQINLLLLARLS